MHSTWFYNTSPTKNVSLANPCCLDAFGEKLISEKKSSISLAFAQGDIFSKVEDLFKWSIALKTPGMVLSEFSLQKLFSLRSR